MGCNRLRECRHRGLWVGSIERAFTDTLPVGIARGRGGASYSPSSPPTSIASYGSNLQGRTCAMGKVCVTYRVYGEGCEELQASLVLCGTSNRRKPGGSTGSSHTAGNGGLSMRMGSRMG